MSSTVIEQAVKIQQPNKSFKRSSNFTATSQKKFKHDRSNRKRSKSFSGGGPKTMKHVLPTKFLLGGNINDPLNLNSLQDEEINRAMNAVTPKSSPIPTPPRRRGQIEVIIPPNMCDPLNLIDCEDDAEYEQQLCSPVKKGRKKRTRKKRANSTTVYSLDAEVSGGSEAQMPEINRDSAKIPDVTDAKEVKCPPSNLILELSPQKKEKVKRKWEEHGKDNVKKMKYALDKIVSPVIPQPGAFWLKRSNSRSGNWNNRPRQQNKNENQKMPMFKEKNKQYQYGNYNR